MPSIYNVFTLGGLPLISVYCCETYSFVSEIVTQTINFSGTETIHADGICNITVHLQCMFAAHVRYPASAATAHMLSLLDRHVVGSTSMLHIYCLCERHAHLHIHETRRKHGDRQEFVAFCKCTIHHAVRTGSTRLKQALRPLYCTVEPLNNELYTIYAGTKYTH